MKKLEFELFLGLRSPMGAHRRLAAITGSKFFIVLPSVGKLATRWRDCGGHYYLLNCLHTFGWIVWISNRLSCIWPNCLDAVGDESQVVQSSASPLWWLILFRNKAKNTRRRSSLPLLVVGTITSVLWIDDGNENCLRSRSLHRRL